MLILSRREGETIEIPSLGIVIQISAIKQSRAVLGIEAPCDVKIVRGEKIADQFDEAPVSLSQRSHSQLLIELEAEIAALAEMCSDDHKSVADQTARQTLLTLRKLRRQLQAEVGTDDNARPLSDFVAVRSEVLDYLMTKRADQDVKVTPTCVRQSSAGYAIGGPVVCQVA